MVQVVGNFTWYAEFGGADADGNTLGQQLYGHAETDTEAIGAACDYVRELGCKVHVRREGTYIAEVRPGWQKSIIVEDHRGDGVREYELPCFMRLVTAWLES